MRKFRNIFSRSRGAAATDHESDPLGTGAAGAPTPPAGPPPHPYPRPPLLSRRPSLRVTAVLAAGMLAVGVGVGAAVGPAPTASFAGDTPALVAKLISELAAARSHSAPPASSQPAGRNAGRNAAELLAGRRPGEHDDHGHHARNVGFRLQPEAEKPSKTNSTTTHLQGPRRDRRVADRAVGAELRRTAHPEERRPLHQRPADPHRARC